MQDLQLRNVGYMTSCYRLFITRMARDEREGLIQKNSGR